MSTSGSQGEWIGKTGVDTNGLVREEEGDGVGWDLDIVLVSTRVLDTAGFADVSGFGKVLSERNSDESSKANQEELHVGNVGSCWCWRKR